MNSDREPTSRDPLDDLLMQARWPEPSGGSTRRLETAWRELRRPGLRFGLALIGGAALAALVMIALGAWRVLMREAATREVTASLFVSPAPRIPAPGGGAPPAIARVSVPPANAVAPGRPPTPRELIMLRIVERRERTAASTSAPVAPAGADEEKAAIEARLALLIAQADGNVPPELAEKFCAVATRRSLAIVLKLAQRPRTRLSTTDALTRLVDAQTLAAHVRSSVSSAERRRLLAGMLSRSAAAVEAACYLELIAEPATRGDALAALDAADAAWSEAFLNGLDSPRADLRLAAALALGRIDGPVVTQRLIERVAADRNRREAFLALASSRGAAAQAFMSRAAASERFGGLAQSAMAQAEFH